MVTKRIALACVGLLFVLGCNKTSRSSGPSAVAESTTGPGSIEVTPASLDYGEGLIGEPRSLDVTVRNGGDAFLDVSSIALSQDSSPDFNITAGPGEVLIAPLAEIVVSVTYTAAEEDSDTGTLVIQSDDPEMPTVEVPLAGSGIPVPVPDIDVSPASLAFGDVFIGGSSSLDVTITNRGSAALDLSSVGPGAATSPDFSVNPPSVSSLAPGAASTFQVEYTPTSLGADSGEVVVLSNDPDTSRIAVSLSGNGIPVPAPEIDVAPTSLDFGEVFVGSSSLLTVTVSNTGTANLNIQSYSFGASTSDSFSMSPVSPGAIAPGASVTVEISYEPMDTISDTSTLRIESDDANENPLVVSLSGTGIAQPVPDVSVQPTSLDFGQVFVGNLRSLDVTLENSGTAILNVDSVTLGNQTSADFSITRFPSAVINPGASSTVEVRYAPDADGTDGGTLRIATNDPDEALLVVSLSGTGSSLPVPEIDVSPLSLAFGDVVVGSSPSLSVTISNSGTAALSVTNIALGAGSSSDMFISSGSAGMIDAGGSIVVDIGYAPGDVGADSATLLVESDDADEPMVTVSVSGAGIPAPVPEIVVAPGALDFGTLTVGDSSSLQVSIQNTGSADLVVSAVFFDAATAADFTTISGFSGGSIMPGDSASFLVTYAPVDEGADTGSVVILSNDSDEDTTAVSLSGQGAAADPGPQSMTLAWNAPTLNEDGSSLDDLAGFKIYLSGTLTDTFDVGNVTSITLNSLPAGTYHVLATAYDFDGNESDFSGELVVTLPLASP